jgi:hypothetical protein
MSDGQNKEFIKAKYIKIDRKTWTELDVLKKILFENRRVVDLLEELVSVIKPKGATKDES